MVSVTIAGEARKLADVTEEWINRSINKPKSEGLPVCVTVAINEGAVNVRLSTPGCDGTGGGSGTPNRREKEIFVLWEKRGLTAADFRGGNLTAFLKQLQKKLL